MVICSPKTLSFLAIIGFRHTEDCRPWESGLEKTLTLESFCSETDRQYENGRRTFIDEKGGMEGTSGEAGRKGVCLTSCLRCMSCCGSV